MMLYLSMADVMGVTYVQRSHDVVLQFSTVKVQNIAKYVLLSITLCGMFSIFFLHAEIDIGQ